MKTLNLFLSSLFTFVILLWNQAYAQTEKKPSKQETMEWISGKLKESLTSNREFVSYDNGLFSYKKKLSSSDDVCITTIDLNKVTGMSNIFSNDFWIQGNGLLSVKCEKSEGQGKNFVSISGPDYNNYTAPFNIMDQPLIERLKKAFKNLIEYNSPKDPKEAY